MSTHDDALQHLTLPVNLRDYFAAHVVAAMWTNNEVLTRISGGGKEAETLASLGYEQADAMLKARQS
jgi:hypothetical protein